MIPARAYYSHSHRCWFVPVTSELFTAAESQVVEPVRVELRNGELLITHLESSAAALGGQESQAAGSAGGRERGPAPSATSSEGSES